MLGFLLFISFIVHAVAFYWIFQLKRRLNETSEVENMLTVYVEEMQEQNDELIHFLKDFQTTQEPSDQENRIPLDDERKQTLPMKPYSPPSPDTKRKKDHFETSMEAKVLSLSEQGLDHEEIARKLGRGKGEVELLLRLEKSKKKLDDLQRSEDLSTL